MKKRSAKTKARNKGFDHHCEWRKAAIKLAGCVVATLRTGGKIGMGTGMVMKVKDGKKTVERWDKDFIEALAFIGIEVTDGAKKKKPARRRGLSVGIECEHGYDHCPTCDAPAADKRRRAA